MMSVESKATMMNSRKKERENINDNTDKQLKYYNAENMEDGLEDDNHHEIMQQKFFEDIIKDVTSYVKGKNDSMQIVIDEINFLRKILKENVGNDFFRNWSKLSYNGNLYWSDGFTNRELKAKKEEEEKKDTKFTETVKRKTEEMVTKLVASRTKCKAKLKEMKDRIACLEDENNDLQSKVKEQQHINNMQKLNIKGLSSDNERLNKQCHELQKTKRQEIDEQERLTTEFNDKISDLHKDKQELEKNIRENKREIEDLKNELRNNLSRMQFKEVEISTLKEENNDIIKEKQDINEKINKMKKQMRQMDEKTKKEIRQLTKKINILDEKYKEKHEKLQVCEEDKKKLSDKIKELENKIKDIEMNIGELEIDKKKTMKKIQHNEQLRQTSYKKTKFDSTTILEMRERDEKKQDIKQLIIEQIRNLDLDEKHKEKEERLHVCEEDKKKQSGRIKELENQIITIVQSIYQMTQKCGSSDESKVSVVGHRLKCIESDPWGGEPGKNMTI